MCRRERSSALLLLLGAVAGDMALEAGSRGHPFDPDAHRQRAQRALRHPFRRALSRHPTTVITGAKFIDFEQGVHVRREEVVRSNIGGRCEAGVEPAGCWNAGPSRRLVFSL